MSYLTIEVMIDNGQIAAKEPKKLPESATGLLTIIQTEGEKPARMSPLEAFEALQRHLNLDENKAAEWMATVPDARR